MGGFEPISATIMALNLANQFASRNSQQKQQMAAQEASNAAQTQQLVAAQAIGKQRRDGDLKTAMASRRALLGAGGLGAADGSGKALLLGLTKSADADAAASDQAYAFRSDGLASRLAADRQRSLLDIEDNRRRAILGLAPAGLTLANSLSERVSK